MLTHASCVAYRRRGVLLRGPSGAGKSSLALALVERGWVLVGDDQVRLEARGGRLFASPPATLAGRIELRGAGILALPYLAEAPVLLVLDLAEGERLPEPERAWLAGIGLPLYRLPAAGAAERLPLLLRQAMLAP
ncbi:MAG: HPr kinase/phosphorylase [Thalassobaculales bacterium]